ERNAFAAAEAGLLQGRTREACTTFGRLSADEKGSEVASWAALRSADCLLAAGDVEPAVALLRRVSAAGHTQAAIQLARFRLEEATGAVLHGTFNADLYRLTEDSPAWIGTVADEAAVRE